jgi:HlyD family secretion protein
MSKKARIIAGVVAVAVIGGVVAFSVGRESRQRVAVQTQKAGRRDLVSAVSASGEIKPKKFVNVSANVSGRITDLLVKEGDRVRRGQVLAKIDAERFAAGERMSAAALEAARADVARSEADLKVAQANFERAKQMHAQKLISDQQFDQAQADLDMRRAALDASRRRVSQQAAQLETQRDDLAKTVVVSPMDGVITSLVKEEGEVVIGAQSFQPTVIMTIGDLSAYEVEVMVDETDIRNVALGQKAKIRVDALEGTKIEGEVTEIGSSAIPRGGAAAAQPGQSTANQAKDFKVTVTVLDPPPALRSGLNATAEIETAKKASVLAIPIQAVVVREVNKEGKVVDPDALQASGPEAAGAPPQEKGEEKEGVFVARGGQVTFTPVQTGIVGETDIEITGGIKEGDEIVTGSYKTLRTLKDQAKIKPETKKNG